MQKIMRKRKLESCSSSILKLNSANSRLMEFLTAMKQFLRMLSNYLQQSSYQQKISSERIQSLFSRFPHQFVKVFTMTYVLIYSIQSCLVSIILQNFESRNFYKFNNPTVRRICVGPRNKRSKSSTLALSTRVDLGVLISPTNSLKKAFQFFVFRFRHGHGGLLFGGGGVSNNRLSIFKKQKVSTTGSIPSISIQKCWWFFRLKSDSYV